MPTDKRLLEFAREMRKNPMPLEKAVWKLLKGAKVEGYQFRRQQPIGPYIVGFYCANAKLIIELDGKLDYDRIRTEWLRSRSYTLFRFGTEVPFDDEIELVATIREHLRSLKGL